MADVEKVIEALHCRAYDDDFPCSICAYYRKDEKPVAKCDYQGLMDDAMELLKEQQKTVEELKGFINGFSRNAVPVVRCKDCKHAKAQNKNEVWCCFVDDGFSHEPDWFCADGERKSE